MSDPGRVGEGPGGGITVLPSSWENDWVGHRGYAMTWRGVPAGSVQYEK